MQQTLKRIFGNMTFFAVNAIGVTVPLAIGIVINIIAANSVGILSQFIEPIAIFILRGVYSVLIYISYKMHNKNLMKGLVGGLVTLIPLYVILNLQKYLAKPEASFWITGLYIVLTVLAFALLINHFIINSDRNPSSINVYINQIIVLLFCLVSVVNLIIAYIVTQQITPVFVGVTLNNILAVTMQCNTIVCIETKLDAYRIKRTEAGWTDEKGYPEDYDRTQNYGK